MDEQVDMVVKDVCLENKKRHEIRFLEIGTVEDHIHMLVQSLPTYSVTKVVTMFMIMIAREIFRRCPQMKKQLLGGEFWTDGYFKSTVSKHGDENTVANYVK